MTAENEETRQLVARARKASMWARRFSRQSEADLLDALIAEIEESIPRCRVADPIIHARCERRADHKGTHELFGPEGETDVVYEFESGEVL